MRTSVSAIAAAAGAATIALLVPSTAFAASPQEATERSASRVVASDAFREALAEGTVVSTQDYCEPGANTPGRCH